eukprot:m.230760 g.230760  ORF g.230760 m.230760 type:complete len:56 (+) comp18141_c0_seq1:25-192(+)
MTMSVNIAGSYSSSSSLFFDCLLGVARLACRVPFVSYISFFVFSFLFLLAITTPM